MAPAYSLAATLAFIVAAVGLQAPAIAVLAFVPMLLCSIGYNEMNKADPDCGTTFTWATRAFNPRLGWAGGWGIVAADVLVMASLAQVAGQYIFLLFNADGIGGNPASSWVLLVGVLWIVAMTYICYRGIEVSANFQKALLSIEIGMLLVFSVVALVRVGTGHHPAESLTPSIRWLNPFDVSSFNAFASGLILMVFIYWGWDTALSVNEETKDPEKTPGRAAMLSTVILLVTYAIVIFAAQSFSGIGDNGHRPAEPRARQRRDLGARHRGLRQRHGGIGVQPPAAADGAVLGRRVDPDHDLAHRADHAVDGDLQGAAQGLRQDAPEVPDPDGVDAGHGRHLDRAVRGDELRIGRQRHRRRGDFLRRLHRALLRAHRVRVLLVLPQDPAQSARNLWMRGIIPLLGGLIMYFLGGWSLWEDYDVATGNSYTTFTVPGLHWQIGGVFVIVFLTALVGLIMLLYCRFTMPAFFRGKTLTTGHADPGPRRVADAGRAGPGGQPGPGHPPGGRAGRR